MPELPEVEIIRLGLNGKIIGLRIIDTKILNPKSFTGDPKRIKGKKIISVYRKAKILGLELENNLTMLFHLKMSGQLIYHGTEKFIGGHPTKDMQSDLPNYSTRVIFKMDNDSILYFNDQRKFGWVKILDQAQLLTDRFLNTLGPEPLEKKFDWQLVKQKLMRHKSLPVKVALLDQKTVAGIGNIYASESCFLARINPMKKVVDLTDADFKNLKSGIVKSLKNAIKFGGSSKTHFVNAEGIKGLFLNYANVYAREGESCKVCKSEIEKIRQSGRSTFYCPFCQK